MLGSFKIIHLCLLSVTIASVGCQLGASNRPAWLVEEPVDTRVRSHQLADANPKIEHDSKVKKEASRESKVSTVGFSETETDAVVSSLPFEEDEPATQSESAIIKTAKPPAPVDAVIESGMALESTEIDSNSIKVSGFPIDLPSVLRLAGADNWNVKIAQERICEAIANYEAARVAWLPSLNFGIGYNHHEGQIQATEGDVVEVSRGSLFVGGGARIADAPLTGAAGGPARMFVDFSITDALFGPLAARQKLKAEKFRKSSVFNDVMLEASLAYFELVRAQSQAAIAFENLREAEGALKLTTAFVEAGKGTSSDTNQMQVIINRRRRDLAAARAEIGIASANLANVLQLDVTKLDPDQGLFALQADAIPIDLVQSEANLAVMIAHAQATRPEVSEAICRAQSANTQLRAEQVRPFVPNVSFGYSGGAFGGGTGGDLPKLDSRSDLDLLMNWELRNMGAGNRAARGLRSSQLNQTIYASRQIRDQVANQVADAFHRVRLQAESMGIWQDSIRQAEDALRLNIEAIRGLESEPLESILSLEQLARSRRAYLDSVIDYNRFQLELLRAIGTPLDQDSSCATNGVTGN